MRLVQRQPSVVLEVGETTVALDREDVSGLVVARPLLPGTPHDQIASFWEGLAFQ